MSTYNSGQQVLPLDHTPHHHNCPACMGADKMGISGLSPEMTFPEAFEVWLARRVIEHVGVVTNAHIIKDRTERDLRQYARAAGKFFGALRLNEILVGHLLEYQQARAINQLRISTPLGGFDAHPWHKLAGANLIRKEVQTVMRVMRSAGAWTQHHEDYYEPLERVWSDVQRAMSPNEQQHWLRVTASRPEWRVVYQWSLVALQTTASTNELRALHTGDIFFCADGNPDYMQVRNEGAKNKFRLRTIPLQTPEVHWALKGLIERARMLGARGPQSYLFPFHVTADRYDPSRPMSVWGMRKQWEEARKSAGLEWLRVYDLRHTAITRMAEAGVPIHVIMSFAGHISQRMQEHYTTISMQAKRRWAAAAWAGEEMPYMPNFCAPPAAREVERASGFGVQPERISTWTQDGTWGYR